MIYTILDYIWIDGSGGLRSKVKIVHDKYIQKLEEVEIWNFDGSSTGQADSSSSEIFLHPVKMVLCPFRRNGSWIVLCDCYTSTGQPAKYNHRYDAKKIFDKYMDQKPWWGLEAEIFLFDCNTNLPVGFNPDKKQGPYYCGVGGKNVSNIRQIVDEHMEACLFSGLKVSGTNLEVAPSQIEYQLGPIEGIDAADQLWISRYLLEKITEKYNIYVVYHPKALKGDWNGSGQHTNVSTEATRREGGINIIMDIMKKFEAKHMEHMLKYGEYNRERMTGEHETSCYDKFTYGIANRKCSIRIPNETVKNGCGYWEDRRPSSNCDPYLVTSTILQTLME